MIADAVVATICAQWEKRAAVALVIAVHVAAMVNAIREKPVRAAKRIAGRVPCARTACAKQVKTARIVKTIVHVLVVTVLAPWEKRAEIVPSIAVRVAAIAFAKRARRVRAVQRIAGNASFAAMGFVKRANRAVTVPWIAVARVGTRFARAAKIATIVPAIADRVVATMRAKRGKTVCRVLRIVVRVAAMEHAMRVSRAGIVRAIVRVVAMASVRTEKRATVVLPIVNQRAAMELANVEKHVRHVPTIAAVLVAIRRVGMANAGPNVARPSARVPMIVDKGVVVTVNVMVASLVRAARTIARHCVVTGCANAGNLIRAPWIVTWKCAATSSVARANLPAIASTTALDLVAPILVAMAIATLPVESRRAIAPVIALARVA